MNDANVSVRVAEHGDMAAILALAPRLAEGIAPWRDQAEAREAGERWLADSLGAAARGDGAVFVAVGAGGKITGVISVRQVTHFTGERDGYIGELAVAASAVRQGIGRTLVGAAREWAAARGLVNLTLHTGAYSTGARESYAALGFRMEEVRLTLPL